MRDDRLHPTPEWGGILRRELRRTVFSVKGIRLVAVIVGLLAGAALVATISSWVAGSAVAYAALGVMGAVWPSAIWGRENWGSRDYRWSLPVEAMHHDLSRVALGWLVLMGATVLLMTTTILTDHQSGYGARAVYLSQPSFWFGVALLPTVLYFIVSAAWLTSRTPWLWLGVPYLISMFTRRGLEQSGYLPAGLGRVVEAFFVFFTAPVSRFPPDSWMWANLFAVLVAILCMLIAIRRYKGSSR